MIGKDSSFLFVVSREGVESYGLPQAAEMEELVEEIREALKRPGRREFARYVSAARRLYDAVILPAADRLAGKKRLLIAPDGALYYLPFELLLSSQANTEGRAVYKEQPFLLRQWAISYIPSAGVLASLESGKARAEPLSSEAKQFIAFADPVYPPAGKADYNEASRVARSLAGRDRFRLERLSDSGREVKSIAAAFEPESAIIYLRQEAREENVKNNPDLSRARRIHFAAHGLISEPEPEYSGLVLSLDEDHAEDGILQVYEIFDLRLTADLVVLSACRTGLGKKLRGEGVIGLSRAFLYAGASSVVVSLWQVADKSTADLMVRFYQGMEGENDKSESLRQAKLKMIESSPYSHPYYWAPFILIGDPR